MRKLLKNSVQVFLLIAIVFFTMMLIMMTSCKHSCEAHRKPEAPKNLAPTLDSVIAVDSVSYGNIIDIDGDGVYEEWEDTTFLSSFYKDGRKIWLDIYGDTIWHVYHVKEEYHGKEGKSEYGQYEPSDRDWNRSDLYDLLESDEEKMWIGNDGDTIWE
tara:strand:- start:1893 stop:2366 length:474 start_codon:yes stop_codon:yes gene_type:complete